MIPKDNTIKRTKQSPGVSPYYKAIERILELQRGILTGVLPHYGERGRNDEQRLVSFLKQVLPRRFGLGTGFIVNSDHSSGFSNQTDIIIADEFYNSPLYRELAAQIYPIETVYATIEVKGTLYKKTWPDGKTDLDKFLLNIAKIRRLAKKKYYMEYRSGPKDGNNPEKLVVKKHSYSIPLAPRGYLYAYSVDGWNDLDEFAASLKKALLAHKEAHLHGVIVLDKDWFAKQLPYENEEQEILEEGQTEIIAYNDNCLLRFINSLLHGIQSMRMDMFDLDRYHAPLDQKLPDTDTGDSSFSFNIYEDSER